MLSEGQRNDINYAIPLLEQVDIKESDILADRGYDSNKLMDYIYAMVVSQPYLPEKGLNLTVTVTGIFTKKDI